MPKGVYNRVHKSHNFQDLTGQRFNRWTVLRREENYLGKYAAWWCRCDCGTEKNVKAVNLRNGTSKSCGCYHRESARKRMSERNTEHLRKSDAAFNIVYCIYRWQAKNAGREFSISKSEFFALTQQPCFYCGDTFSNTKKSHAGDEFRYNGIDRVENNQGYRIGNVVPCCHTCNAMKQEFPQELLFEKVEKIYKKHFIVHEETT